MVADITAEGGIIDELHCALVAWSTDSLVVQYNEPEQRLQLIGALKPLGWLYPVEDPGDIDAMLLDIRRSPLKSARVSPTAVMVSNPMGLYILGFLVLMFVLFGMADINHAVNTRHAVRALLSSVIYFLITIVVLYTGLQYVSLNVRLTLKDITFTTMLSTITLRVQDIKSCSFELYHTFGAPFYTVIFILKSGQMVKMPAPIKGFENLPAEMKKRYTFQVVS